MENKFSFDQHGLNDYMFSTAACLIPRAIKLSTSAARHYTVLGISLLAYNIISDHRFAAKRIIEQKAHKYLDLVNLGILTSMAFLPVVKNDRKTLLFHVGYATLAALHIQLSKWKKERTQLDHLFI